MNRRTDRLMNWKDKLNPKLANNSINSCVTIGQGGNIREGNVEERGNAAAPNIGRIAQGKYFHFKAALHL